MFICVRVCMRKVYMSHMVPGPGAAPTTDTAHYNHLKKIYQESNHLKQLGSCVSNILLVIRKIQFSYSSQHLVYQLTSL